MSFSVENNVLKGFMVVVVITNQEKLFYNLVVK